MAPLRPRVVSPAAWVGDIARMPPAAPDGSFPAHPEPQAEIVESLEELLARARRGELRGIAVAIVDRDGIATDSAGEVDAHLVAGAALLSHRVTAAFDRAR